MCHRVVGLGVALGCLCRSSPGRDLLEIIAGRRGKQLPTPQDSVQDRRVASSVYERSRGVCVPCYDTDDDQKD